MLPQTDRAAAFVSSTILAIVGAAVDPGFFFSQPLFDHHAKFVYWLSYCVCAQVVSIGSKIMGTLGLAPLRQGRSQGVASVAKATPISSKKKIIRQKKRRILFTTFTLHIKLHSELQWRRNALNVLWCYKSTDLTPLALMQLLTDLPPLQHGDLTF